MTGKKEKGTGERASIRVRRRHGPLTDGLELPRRCELTFWSRVRGGPLVLLRARSSELSQGSPARRIQRRTSGLKRGFTVALIVWFLLRPSPVDGDGASVDCDHLHAGAQRDGHVEDVLERAAVVDDGEILLQLVGDRLVEVVDQRRVLVLARVEGVDTSRSDLLG